MDPIEEFEKEVSDRIRAQGENRELEELAQDFLVSSVRSKYSYNFSWLGQPIFQYPQDIVALQGDRYGESNPISSSRPASPAAARSCSTLRC